ncbi:MAG: hypothetical protein LKI76_00015 [Megasphaera sp.]|jgi:hypothetical protein|nr:hypothetical protein [Megasphaera sp.]
MNSIVNDFETSAIYENLAIESNIENMVSNQDYIKACDAMQKYIDNSNFHTLEKGWYLQQLARYKYYVNTEQSNQLQKSAFKYNSQLLKPRDNISYSKIRYIDANRILNIRNYLKQYPNCEELTLTIDNMMNDLSFGMESDKFEQAMQSAGQLLGFISQRPDKEIGKGPDNIWCGPHGKYLLFECKNQVESTRKEISKSEAGQMNNHCAWFDKEYGTDVWCGRFMIIPTKYLAYQGDFTHDVRIIRKNMLRKIKFNIQKFIQEIRLYDLEDITDTKMQEMLSEKQLDMENFMDNYSESYCQNKRK